MKELCLFLILSVAFPVLAAVPVLAHSDTNLHLQITPRLCIVDVIQDGNNQVIQTPSPGCEAALPILLAEPTPTATQTSPLFALPFAGREPHVQQPILRPQVEGTLAPIASRGAQISDGSTSSRMPMAITGVGLALAATAVGIDIALFELHYSRSLATWTKKQTAGRVFRR